MPKRNAKGVTSGVGIPHRMTGRDGDITIRKTRDGKIVYIKEHGAWHPINTGIDVAQLKKDVDRLSRLFDNSNKNSNATITTNLINVRKNTSTATVDPKIKFTIAGTEKFVLGVDDSDSDKFKIDTGGDIGGATKVTLDSSGNLTTAGLITATRLNVSSGETEIGGDSVAPIGAGDFGYHVNAGGFAAHGIGIAVDSYTTTSADAQSSTLTLISKGDDVTAGYGDAYVRLLSESTSVWAFGNDASDSNKFKIHTGTALVDSSLFTLDTSGSLALDVTTSGDDAENATAMHVDFDRTVAGSGTAAHNDIGIDLDVNSASLGTSSAIGLDIDVVGATTGTHTAYGIDLNVSGADVNYGLYITTPDGGDGRKDIRMHSSADAADYCNIFTGTNGSTTIETVDDVGELAHIILNINGGLYIDVDSGTARISDGGSTYTPNHEGSITTKAYVDGLNKFCTHISNYTGRMGTVNYWYVSNQSFGIGVTAGDFGYAEIKYSVFNAVDACVITGWAFRGYVTSTEPYELALWQTTPPADGGTVASAAARIGSVQDLEDGGGNVLSNRIYHAGETGLSVSVPAGQQIYLVHKYTDGSGSKSIYGSLTLNFEAA